MKKVSAFIFAVIAFLSLYINASASGFSTYAKLITEGEIAKGDIINVEIGITDAVGDNGFCAVSLQVEYDSSVLVPYYEDGESFTSTIFPDEWQTKPDVFDSVNDNQPGKLLICYASNDTQGNGFTGDGTKTTVRFKCLKAADSTQINVKSPVCTDDLTLLDVAGETCSVSIGPISSGIDWLLIIVAVTASGLIIGAAVYTAIIRKNKQQPRHDRS